MQETGNCFTFSVVVADNGASQSARELVARFGSTSAFPVVYCVESEQNIALVRNKALEHVNGEFIAFIDDDEFPGEQWLVMLYKAIYRYGADGILSPVLPFFEEEPPQWVLKGHFFDRPTHPTGHVLEWKNTRTGNALLKRDLFKVGAKWFDPAFGSGGEDRDFFRRMIDQGHVFVWCNEAPVFETVPPMRWKRTVLIKRALLRGKMALNTAERRSGSLFTSAVAVAIYSCCLPVLLFLGHHVFMKYLIKDCDHLGKLLASLGIDLVGEKYVGG